MIFPVEQWFDTTRRIPKDDVEITEAQMVLYAVKDDRDPGGIECKSEYKKMRRAVAEHNKRFDP